MYKLTTEAEFDGAHFLKGYEGKCSNIHGHRWKVVVKVKSETVEDSGSFRGMIVDFKVLKKDLRRLCEELDHALIIEEGSLKETTLKALMEEEFLIVTVPFRPTAENLAKYFYEKMKEKGYDMDEATVYETPKNAATYSE